MLKIYTLLLGLGVIKTHTFSVPIVSVGNITLGGSGKTPFIYYLARLLTQHSITHVVVSRGYKKALSGTCIVHDGKTLLAASPFSCGDEPFMLASKLKTTPIVVDSNKVRGIQCALMSFKPQIVLLDDSFQSKYIVKNLDIVLFNALNQKKDLKFFPVGKLRENLSSLQRADLVVFTKHNLCAQETPSIDLALLEIEQKNIPYIYSEMHASLVHYSISSIQPMIWSNSMLLKEIPAPNKLFSFCGIGDPLSFERTTQIYQKCVVKHSTFRDHYNYCQNENKFLQSLQELYKNSNITGVLTTHKDFVKIKTLSQPFLEWCYKTQINFFVVDIEIKLADEGVVLQKIKSLIP